MIFGLRTPAAMGTSSSELASSTTSRLIPISRQSQRKREPRVIASTGTARLTSACSRRDIQIIRKRKNAEPKIHNKTTAPSLLSSPRPEIAGAAAEETFTGISGARAEFSPDFPEESPASGALVVAALRSGSLVSTAGATGELSSARTAGRP